jgi:HAD superfamily hydrolase (TIGR01490 family)
LNSSSDIDAGRDSRPVAVFDFDGTLTCCDTFLPFLRACCRRGRFWAGLLGLAPVVLVRSRSRATLKELFVQRFLRGRSDRDLATCAERFCEQRMPALLNHAMMGRLRWHQREEHRVILLSASPGVYLRPWARRNGIAEVIATELEFAGGVCTGRLATENCRGVAKVQRLAAHFGRTDASIEFAYGDSPADQPVLSCARHPSFRGHRAPGYSVRGAGALVRALI